MYGRHLWAYYILFILAPGVRDCEVVVFKDLHAIGLQGFDAC